MSRSLLVLQSQFNIDDLINNIRLNGVEGMQEPEVEELVDKIMNMHEELARKVQIQQELSEQACFRQEQEDKKKVEEVEQIRCQIEEIKFKHRKLRYVLKVQSFIKFKKCIVQTCKCDNVLKSALFLQDEV
ncbi:hypothetical protein ABVT39_004343 [Epinephelus coioides]